MSEAEKVRRFVKLYGYGDDNPPPANVMREILEEVRCECGAAGSGERHEPWCPFQQFATVK